MPFDLTDKEKQRVIEALDRLSRSEIERILMAASSFAKWLASTFASIYRKVCDVINDMWNWLKSCFA